MAQLDVEKLQNILNSLEIPQADFIKQLHSEFNIRKDTSRTWFRGVRNPRDEAIFQMAQLLGVEPHELIEGGSTAPGEVSERAVSIPMFSTTDRLILSSIEDRDVIDVLRIKSTLRHKVISKELLEDVFALKIADASHGPFVPYGSIVTWKYGTDALLNDSIVIINQKMGLTYLRRVGIEGGEIVLYDLRDDYREDPKRPGNSELILGVALKIEYNPTSDFSL